MGNLGIGLVGKSGIGNLLDNVLSNNKYSAAIWIVSFVEGFYWEWRG